MKMVPNWQSAWRWLSIQFPLLNTAFLGTWSVLPDKFQDALPLPWVIGIAIALIVIGMLGRLVKQQELP